MKAILLLLVSGAAAFVPITSQSISSTATALHFFGGGSGADRLDEEWEKQQEILRNRRKPQAERDAEFQKIEQRRAEASQKQTDMWSVSSFGPWKTLWMFNGPVDDLFADRVGRVPCAAYSQAQSESHR